MQACSEDDIVALELALEGGMDHPLWGDGSCSSPKKRQRSKIEQVRAPAECFAVSHVWSDSSPTS